MKKQWRSLSDSKHYRQCKFVNLSPTPMLAEDASYGQIIRNQFRRPDTVQPSYPLPSAKTNLATLHSETPVVVWFGQHSSYLIHCKGTNILVDPVFSGRFSPIAGMMKAFPGTDVYKPEDMPAIDLMIITHNHYDHLDRKTLTQLKAKTHAFYAPLGVGRDIEGCCGMICPLQKWTGGKRTTYARHYAYGCTGPAFFRQRAAARRFIMVLLCAAIVWLYHLHRRGFRL